MKFIIDQEDAEKASKYTWRINSRGYVVANLNKFDCLLLHRFLTDCPKGKVVDHIDGNKLNNRRENLRVVSQSQNLMNMHKERGISWHKKAQKWEAFITKNYKKIYLGLFPTKQEALIIRRQAEERYFGQFASVLA